VCPTHRQLPTVTAWPGTVVSTLPPDSAAKSIVTEPGGMFITISFVISTGAFLPGINAVVMITLVVLTSSSNILRAASNHSGDISFAYPPAAEPSSLRST